MSESDALQRMDALRTQRQQAAAAGDVETVIQCRNETGALTAQLWQARRNAAQEIANAAAPRVGG